MWSAVLLQFSFILQGSSTCSFWCNY